MLSTVFRLLVIVAVGACLLLGTDAYSICSNPAAYQGRVVDDPWRNARYRGECVSYVKTCSGDHRPTSQWRRGVQVRGNYLPYGTAIATFPRGSYSGHAAIYVGQNSAGIQVYDQWRGKAVSSRTIQWNGSGISNNGNSFYAIA